MATERGKKAYLKTVESPASNFDQVQLELNRIIIALNRLSDTGVQTVASSVSDGGSTPVLDAFTKRDGTAPPTGDWDFNNRSIINMDNLYLNTMGFIKGQRIATEARAKRYAFFTGGL